MKHPTRPYPAACLTATFLFLLPAVASARSFALEPQVPADPESLVVPAPPIPLGDRAQRVDLDEPGDGSLWARGTHWKARFDAEGATYYAGFGPRQPRSISHALSPDRVTVGGVPLEFERAATPRSFGDRVEMDRGSFVEAYELDAASIEQLFVFESLPRAGDLVVHIPIASELAGFETDAGLEFRGENGRVSYSRAVAIDARGVRAVAATRLEDGAITIRVDAGFLAHAELPLVIDPVISQFWLDSFDPDSRAPDMAWDPFHQVWLAVYQEAFSATDIDVFAKVLGSTGLTLSTGYVDFTSASWRLPRVANNGGAHQFLVVAERTSGSVKTVQGRICTPNGTILTFGSQFDIGGPVPGDKLAPDVGGDPRSIAGTHFLVVFEHVIGSGDGEVAYRLVTAAGVAVGTEPALLPDAAVERNSSLTISRSNGGMTWLLGWVRTTSAFPVESLIMGARIRANGTVASLPFQVAGGFQVISASPCASSPLAGSERSVITFSSRPLFPLGSKADIYVAALDGATLLHFVNLMTLENSSTQALDQIEPSVDSDGQHFLVTYSEVDAVFGGFNSFGSDLHLAGGQLGLSQSHVQLHPGLGIPQHFTQVAAVRSPASLAHRYGVIYEVGPSTGTGDISAVLFDGVQGGASSAFCFGDGSGTACPCGNNGAPGRGCANSTNASGAALTASGVASTVSDTLRLQANGMPSSSTCLFFQGNTATSGNAFGDGLLCISGSTIRLATKPVTLGAAQYPQTGSMDPAISVRGMVPLDGGTRVYQAWYRNSAAFCTSATFNLTSGISVSWAR